MSHWMKRAVAAFLGACVAASLLVVATDGVSQAGEDKTLCRAVGPERVAISAAFAIDACFDGKNLVLRNRKEIVLRVSRSGSPQRGVLSPVGGVPTVAAGLIKAAHAPSDPDLLPPNYELRIPVSNAAGSIEVFGVKAYQQQYVLIKGFITAFGLEGPLLGAAQSFVELNQSLISTWSNLQNCGRAARGYFGRVGCDANYTRDVAIALVRFTATFVDKVQIPAAKAKFSVEGIRNILGTAEWVNAAVGDFGAFIKSERRLSIAAASPTAGGPGTPPVGPAPVLSQTSGPAGRLVSFSVEDCPATPPGQIQALNVMVEKEEENRPGGGGGLINVAPDGSIAKEGIAGSSSRGGWPYFKLYARGHDAGYDPPVGEYEVRMECVLTTLEEGFNTRSETAKTYAPALFRVTGPAPALRLSATTARVGDVVRVTPTAGCPTGTAAPEPYASIYMVPQNNDALPFLSRGRLAVQPDGFWTQEFPVQKGAVPGRYMVVGHCSHVNAQTPGQNYAVTDSYLTVLPEQTAGPAAAVARSAPPSTAATGTPKTSSPSTPNAAPRTSPAPQTTTTRRPAP